MKNTKKRAYAWMLLCCMLLGAGICLPVRTAGATGATEDTAIIMPEYAARTDAGLEWTPLYARLNQRMATRSGPSTAYTEELGTLPQDTEISIIWQEMGSVPWALVEYSYRDGLYRAYTGMKRIETSFAIPWVKVEPVPATLSMDVLPRYGPGEQYAALADALWQGKAVDVCAEDSGYAMIEYLSPADGVSLIRSWVPLAALSGYPR